MMKYRRSYLSIAARVVLLSLYALLTVHSAEANPNRNGETGLLLVPSADTLDAGNICIGVWCDSTQRTSGTTTRMPVSLTMGIGTFWEIYGTYPNILLNNDEDRSGSDGTAILGMKLRFGTNRADPRKTAIDLFARRYLNSTDKRLEGITDLGVRLIQLYRTDDYALHFSLGYIRNADPKGGDPLLPPLTAYKDEFTGTIGGEYFLGQRSKATLELMGGSSRIPGQSVGGEILLGYQYFLSPHLTLNVGMGGGVNGEYPDFRFLVGLSTCQGIGSYIKPVPQLVKERQAETKKKARPVKIVPLSPLLVKSPAPKAVSALEVPVESDEEGVIIRTYGKVAVTPLSSAAPVVLPPTISLELPGTPPSADAAAAGRATELIEQKALEYTQARMTGVSPLYGVVYQEDAVTKGVSDSLKPPESMRVYRKFSFPDIIFEYNSVELSPDVRKSLSEVADILRADTSWKYIRIDGHTDSIGSVKYNMELSLRRAISVANYLINKEGIDPGRIFVKGFGKSKPIADNATPEGRARNRRFEILFLVDKK